MEDPREEGFAVGAHTAGRTRDDESRIMGADGRPDPDELRIQAATLTGNDTDEEEEFEPWSSQLYGAMVKNARKRAGYSTAQAFSDSIFRRTRVYISRDVLYKIEQGRQNPDIAQFMAINLSLYGAPVPSKVTMPCICPEWVEIASNGGEIPPSWRRANTRAIEEATGEHYETAEAAAKAAKDDPSLFGYGTLAD